MMKLIKAIDLQHWADSKDSEHLMPELMRRLIHASIKDITRISFPNEECVDLPGFDGVLETSFNNPYVPVGKSAFEIGTSTGKKAKADHDYNNRTKEISDEEKANTHFVFVIARKWKTARKWESDRNCEGKWKSVRVLTAVELEDWLSLCPSVAAWLAYKMGILINEAKIECLEDFWARWSVNIDGLVLNYDILIGGREQEVQKMVSYVSNPNLVCIESSSSEESLAFAVVSLLQNCNHGILDRAVIAHDERTLESLLKSYGNIVVISKYWSDNISFGVQNNRNSVVIASYSSGGNHQNDTIELPAHDYQKFQKSLETSGLSESQAVRLAVDTGRDIAVLRRNLKFDAMAPTWLKRDDLIDVIPAIMMGRWNEDCQGDKDMMKLLSGKYYEEYSPLLQKWLLLDNSPFGRIKNSWHLVSPLDTFLDVKNYITDSLFDKITETLKTVMADIDPNAMQRVDPNSFAYTLGERKYSGQIRNGLCLTLILMALYRDGTQEKVDRAVKDILKSTDYQWWLTYMIGDEVSFLAEASPKAFLGYIEEDLKKDDSLMKKLFTPVKRQSFMGFSYEVTHTHILFALEMLAWEPAYLIRVGNILSQLSAIENESNVTNKPINTLVDIFRLWFPKTSVNAEGRADALETLYRKNPTIIFKVCVMLATRWDSQHVSYSLRVSRWRMKEIVSFRRVFGYEFNVVLKKVCELIISKANPNQEEAIQILGIAMDNAVPMEFRNALRSHLIKNEMCLRGNKSIYRALMDKINRFKNNPSATWRILDTELSEWEELMDKIAPTNIMDRLEYLFDNGFHNIPAVHQISDYNERYNKAMELRLDAVNSIIEAHGVEAFVAYARGLENPSNAFRAFAMRDDAIDYFDMVFIEAKKNLEQYRYMTEFFAGIAKNWDAYVDRMKLHSQDDALWFPLVSVYGCQPVWDFVELLDEKQQAAYWSRVSSFEIPPTKVNYMLAHFEKYGCLNNIVRILYHVVKHPDHYPLDHIPVLDYMLKIMPRINRDMRDNHSYEFKEVLEWIESQKDVSDDVIMKLEMPYVLALDGSLSDWKLYDIILNSPQFIADLVDCIYLSEDPEKRAEEENSIKQDENRSALARLGYHILSEFHTMPCTDKNGTIHEDDLREYVKTLREIGSEKKKLKMTDHTIGQLLAHCPKITTDYPPVIICEIIDGVDSENICEGFRIELYNRMGSTVRMPYDGGYIEHNRSERFMEFAKQMQFKYPVMAKIYQDLSEEYNVEAVKEDTHVDLMLLDN